MSTILYFVEFGAAAYLALTLFFYALSLRIPAAGFVARLLASYVCLIACASYGVVASIFLRLVAYGGNSQWATARAFKYVMWLTTGVTFTIEDPNDYLNKTRPAVFIGNHQTELDVLMLGYMLPKYTSVTAKKSLKNWPFLGWFMSLSGTVFIDRANSTSARHAMTSAAEVITRDKQNVYMFPEGTRSYAKEPMLLPFKKGAFHLAIQAGVPIVPVVVANYSNVLYLQGWRFNSGSIPMKVLKPIETKGLKTSDVEDLTRDTRELMLREMVSLTAKARGQPVAMPVQSSGDGVVKASGAEATIS
ncbi:1-acyl-sn-glycerol-3-phosphate-acyltransferas-like protein [Hyaloscypha bicolor E]|uniref:1-acyl-sn-glycerol-3-phosphate acyltransferase n=1 Tax=Hyaloscypha bicolor E TaxID=1095630 RepID=A0A2J6SWY7_9HELO|nr:1-acyl-sn-glycerol-3-phosphate-acyltransferas-like protein [Hyaloscypha bicolor E]PMD55173.1 1-acyl-sn-glycerol-3-phosphate-acyltransferas-like protein [Hyaloscypha bicolor E]